MSRGLGAVQRRVLEQLKCADVGTFSTLTELAGDNATRSQIESTRRAVLKLRDAGLVEIRYVPRQVTYKKRSYGGWGRLTTGQVYYDPDMPYVSDWSAHLRMLAARLSVGNVST